VFFEYLKNCPFDKLRNEKELPTAVLNLVKNQPNSVYGIPFEEHVPDLTSKNDILVLNKLLDLE
jgi:glucose-1-phosphate adenylyltransferase